ncbi:MAG: pantetheine-phosphate adenylyltransferase [Hyphomonadaceae bacterium]|nr:pantetheine-phosphate adenylyltransferase [Hyphomonadaceae bacterium]
MANPPRRIGLYPGTFDPVTNGHLDIIRRGCKIVDELVIGVAAVSGAKSPLFTLEERCEIVAQETKNLGAPGQIVVKPFDTLLVKFAESIQAAIIIRGLRAVADFEYEFAMVSMNQKLNPEIETVFLMAEPTHQALASSLVKEIARLQGSVAHFVPPDVERRLRAKFRVS